MGKRGVCRSGIVVVCGVVVACNGQVNTRYSGAQIGQPCTPAIEDNEAFLGFSAGEVSVELPDPNADPGVLVCLVDHFRGRATCPYGQDQSATQLPSVDGASGGPFPSGVGPCVTPSGMAVTGSPGDPEGALVEPQCLDRRAARTVTWSCRCARADGTKGATDCACPGGTECVQLVASIGATTGDVSGAYCVPTGSEYQAFSACAQACDPSAPTSECP